MTKTFITDAYKKSKRDQDKIISPEETVLRAKKQLQKSKLDILQDVRRIDNNRLGIPVYFSLCGVDAHKRTGKRKQMGKGADPAQAEASAIMELIERFSLYDFMQKEHHFQAEKFRNIRSHGIGFEIISRSVHDDVDEQSPEYRFFSELPLRWTKAFDLCNDVWINVPFDWFFQINAYNGSSAGNCMEEAIIQGMSELVERHVCDVIIREKPTVHRIDLNTVDDTVAADLIQRYKQSGIQLYIYDYSIGTGIPVLGGMAYDPKTFPNTSEIVWTAGAMSDPSKALCRLLTEIAQLGGDFNTGSNYEPSGLPKLTDIHQIDEMHPNAAIIPFQSIPSLSNDNIKTEIMNYQKALHFVFPYTFIVDLTHSDIDLPACYTIMPGTRFRERSANASVGMFTARMITSTHLPEVALKKLTAFEKELPDKYYIPFYQGMSLMDMSSYDDALNFFSVALHREPEGEDLSGIYLYMGMCEKNSGRYQQAIENLKQADDIDSYRTDVLNLLGVCYYHCKRYQEAINCFERVIAIDPGSAMDYANLGVNYRASGDNDKAKQCLEKALSLDPGISFAWEHLLAMT
ncbi:MAG: YcaO-like family protein [Candidatus Magnetomorum sp.]|nr:YcaO-like family protein [Candidatus Magnetomorum sp.]